MPKHQTLERQLNTTRHDMCLKLRPYRPLLFVVYTQNIQKGLTPIYFGEIILINYHIDATLSGILMGFKKLSRQKLCLLQFFGHCSKFCDFKRVLYYD